MKQANQKVLEGVVVKVSGDKTVKVETVSYRVHPLYKKARPVTRRYLVHDQDNSAKVGDKVQFVPSRPLSARKRWRLVKSKS